jgi:transcriptional regulator with XRE-family HTH domain
MSAASEVRRAREYSGLSIRDLAARAEVSASTVWRIEAGRMDPTVGTLDRLLAVARGPDPGPQTREAIVSLALGRLTAAEVLRSPASVLAKARRRTSAMLARDDLPRGSRPWLMLWSQLLDGSLEQVVLALIDPSERGYELRQNTPFTGVLSEADRLAAVRQATREHRATRPT